MRVLIVCSYKEEYTSNVAPFIKEQVDEICKNGIECQYYLVKGKGILGYLKNLPGLKHAIATYKPDLIHAHFGLCGLLANLQRKIPVITTFHGCDIQALGLNLLLSKICMILSAYNIFVSEKMKGIAGYSGKNSDIIPCGIQLERFRLYQKNKAKNLLGWNNNKIIIQFAGSFNSPVKNFDLAKKATLDIPDSEIKELAGYSRYEVNLALCAADCLLLTSIREGSPMVIKEAMACNCPIVATDVGDIRYLLNGVNDSYISEVFDSGQISNYLRKVISSKQRTNGREKLKQLCLTSEKIANRIINIYYKVL